MTTDHGMSRTCHADVGLVSRAGGQDAFVGSGDMGMSSQDCGHFAVHMPTEGNFLGSSLGMNLHEDCIRLFSKFLHDTIRSGKGTINVWLHEAATKHRENPKPKPILSDY